MSNLVHITESDEQNLIHKDSLHKTCNENDKDEEIKLNKENTDNTEKSHEIKDVKRTEIIKENASGFAVIIENGSELVEMKRIVSNIAAVSENSSEAAAITENGPDPEWLLDQLVVTEKNVLKLQEIKKCASDFKAIKGNIPDISYINKHIPKLVDSKENSTELAVIMEKISEPAVVIEELVVAENNALVELKESLSDTEIIKESSKLELVNDNSSKITVVEEGHVNYSLLLKSDLGLDIVNEQQNSLSQDNFNHHMSQNMSGTNELYQKILGTHNQVSHTQADSSTLRKLLTTDDWSTLRHRYDLCDFGGHYETFLSKNYEKIDTILNEKSNTNKKKEMKSIAKNKRNKNERVSTQYKEKYTIDAKQSQINVEIKKSIAFFNNYNFHANKLNRVKRSKLYTNISDINCNFSTYKEHCVEKNKLYADVPDTICNLQTKTQNSVTNDESSTDVSDIICNTQTNKLSNIKNNKLHTNVLDPKYNIETNEQNYVEKNKSKAVVSDINYNYHGKKQNCVEKNKLNSDISKFLDDEKNALVDKPRNTNKVIDIKSHLLSYKIKGMHKYKCLSCNYTRKNGLALNRHMTSHTRTDFANKICKHKSKKSGRLTNHTRTDIVHRSHTCEDLDSMGKKTIHCNGKPLDCECCVYRCKRNRNLCFNPIHTDNKHCSCDYCDYQIGKSFSCGLCEFKCGTKFLLVYHMRTHLARNSVLPECPSVKSSSTLTSHVTCTDKPHI